MARLTKDFDTYVIPPNSTFENGPDLKFPIGRFSDIIGILRHEKPLTLHLNQTNLIGLLATGDLEPIGEEEQP